MYLNTTTLLLHYARQSNSSFKHSKMKKESPFKQQTVKVILKGNIHEHRKC